MEIKGRIHCLFEQSGTFKKEFKELGYKAEDYDIFDHFGQTDHIIDLFAEIDKAYNGGASVFDTMSPDDLVMAFFPCTYFETQQNMIFALNHWSFAKWPTRKRVEYALERLDSRTEFHKILYHFLVVVEEKNIRMILENPAAGHNYIVAGQNFIPPTIIDTDRTLHGDIYKKPTAYWFVNCKPEGALTLNRNYDTKTIVSARTGQSSGAASIDRSRIEPAYARWFVKEIILGIPDSQETTLF